MGVTAFIRTSVMEQLRAATRAQHELLDHDPRIIHQLRDINGIVSMLSRWYGFLVPYEEKLTDIAGHRIALVQQRRRLPLLLADLEAHGIVPQSLPLCENLPYLTGDAELLGAMYVSEGSTLGGRYISRHIEQRLGLQSGHGYSFFVGYGEQTGRMWQEFSSIVNEACTENPEPAIQSAQKTFQCIHEWLAAE